MGLLKQIQKSKRRPEVDGEHTMDDATESPSASSVLRPEPEPSADFQLDRRVVEAEQVMAELVEESGREGRIGARTVVMSVPSQEPAAKQPTPEPSSDSASENQLWLIHGETKPASQVRSDEPTWETGARALPAHLERLIAEAASRLHEQWEQSSDSVESIEAAVQEAVRASAELVISDTRLTWKDQDIAGRELLSLLRGKGPLTPLFEDASVNEIYLDRSTSIKVTRKGKIIETPISFRSAAEYQLFVANLLLGSGQALSFAHPIVDGILDDRYQTRVSALHGSVLGSDEPRVSLRIPRQQNSSFYEILQAKVLPATLAAWLAEVVAQGEANILIVGPVGTGKTLMTTALVSEIGSEQRVTTIEDFPEISVPALNVEKLVARPVGRNGQSPVSKVDLLQVAMRRASKRIVVSELKDEEARYYLRALETGFAGSIASIYGEYPEDGLWRLLDLIAAYERSPQQSLVRRIARCFHLIIAMEQVDGKPCVSEVGEVYPGNGGEFVVQPLVRFDGVLDGKRIWRLLATDSYWIRRIGEKGVKLQTGPALLPIERASAEEGSSLGKTPPTKSAKDETIPKKQSKRP